MPADLVGTRIYNGRTGEFTTELGPVFANLLLADEINRAPAKVQSALLEVMQERQVTIGKQTFTVPDPFLVLATQNPIESDGTYPLPEAQLDRFMFKVLVDYPRYEDEIVVVERMIGARDRAAAAADARAAARAAARRRAGLRRSAGDRLRRDAGARDAPAGRARPGGATRARSPSAAARAPRSTWSLGARALAFIRGRGYVLPQDVADLLPDVLRHRLVLSYDGIAGGVTPEAIIAHAARALTRRRAWTWGTAMWRRLPGWSRSDELDAGSPRASDPEALLRRLHWTVLRPLAQRSAATSARCCAAPGLELAELREYQPGDDVRHIDWNVTARADRPYVREAYAERALDVWLLVDVSASVDWGTADCLKRDRALELAAVAGRLLGRHGNRVGALLFAERPLAVVAPAAGRPHLLRLLDALGSEKQREGAGSTDLAAALRTLEGLAKRRSTILVISDFLDAGGWQPALRRLALRHEVIAVRLGDPRERELPDVGLLTLQDPETGEQLVIDTGDRALRERFDAAAAEQSTRLDTELRSCGVEQLVLDTGSPTLPALVRFLRGRRRRGGVAERRR